MGRTRVRCLPRSSRIASLSHRLPIFLLIADLMSDSDEDDVNEYALKVTSRTVWDHHAGHCNRRTLMLDDRNTVSEFLQQLG